MLNSKKADLRLVARVIQASDFPALQQWLESQGFKVKHRSTK